MFVKAHNPRIAQSISSGSEKPSTSSDSGPASATAINDTTVVVQATVAVAVRAIRVAPLLILVGEVEAHERLAHAKPQHDARKDHRRQQRVVGAIAFR